MMTEKSFRFNKTKLDALPSARQGSRDEYRDTEQPGLILRITAGGVKTFSVSRKKRGEHFRVTLGRFPEISVEVARTMAVSYLSEIAVTKKNPNDAKRSNDMAAVTLAEALETYISSRGHRIKASTCEQYRSTLQNFSGDWIKQSLASISRERVEKRHKAITDGSVWFGKDKSTLRAGIGSGSKAQADLWARVLRAVYRFAHDHYRDEEGRTLIPDPPTTVLSTKRQWHGTTRKTERIRTYDFGRWLSAVSSVRGVAEAGRDDIGAAVCDAVEMAFFTGLRKQEIFNLEWARVNIGGRFFWIDTTKNGDPLELPITDTLLQLFRRRLQFRSGDGVLVFPGVRGPIKETRHIIERISAATVPFPNPDMLKIIPFKWHDARRTYGTVAELVGVGSYILKRLLNHRTMRSADVTQGYLHFGADELMEPAKKIEKSILEHAGLLVVDVGVNEQLSKILNSLSEDQKRKLIFSLSYEKEVKKHD